MKYVLFLMFLGLSFSVSAQTSDSTTMVREIDSLFHISEDFYNKRDYKQMLVAAEYATNRAEKLFGRESIYWIDGLNFIAIAQKNIGQFSEAALNYIEIIKMREKLQGKEGSDYASALTNLAVLYKETGRYKESETLYIEGKEIADKIMDHKDPNYASLLFQFARLYIAMGKYQSAEPMIIQSINIRREVLGEKHPFYSSAITTLGGLYYSQGRYFEAEEQFIKAKDLTEKYQGRGQAEFATGLNNLAILYLEMGRSHEAELMLIEAVNTFEQSGKNESPEYASCLSNLAKLYIDKNKHKKAEPLLLKAKVIFEKALGQNHPNYAYSLTQLSQLFQYDGRYNESELFLLEAKDIIGKSVGVQHSNFAEKLNNLGMLYLDMGRYEESKSLVLQAKDTWEITQGKESRLYLLSLNNLAKVCYQLQDYEASDQYLLEEKYLKQKLLVRASTYLSEKELRQYVAKYSRQNNLALSYSMNRPNFQHHLPKIHFDNALFLKGFLLQSALEIRANALTSPETAGDYTLYEGYRRRLAQEYGKSIDKRNQEVITDLEFRANALEKELTQKVSGYADAFRVIDWQEVQNRLQYREAALEFVSFRYFNTKGNPTDSTLYAALVLLPNDTTPHFIPLFEERQLLPQLQRPGLSEELTVKDLYGNRPELTELFWKPLKSLLNEVKTVYYSPSGLLHQLNPAAILDESGGSISQSRQWVRLGSTRELVTGRLADQSFAQEPSGVNHPSSAVVFGGIAYDMDSLAYAAANPLDLATASEAPRKDGNFRYIAAEQPIGTRGESEGAWTPLPGTAREADEVGGMLRKAKFQTEVLKGPAASEERFKSMGANGALSPRILHLATHGFAYPDPKKAPPKSFGDAEPTYKLQDDPMLRSGLLLAGSNFYWKNKRPLANREDGVLVAYEVRDMNLRNTELAVLSACQTGLGDVVGSEGVYGLQRAFRIAGAKFLIVSLWQVPDAQTQELMRLFYQHWVGKKESLREAFNHAQQAMRVKDPNPFWWAGFVLVE